MRDATMSIKACPVSPAYRERLIAVRQLPHSDWADTIDMDSAAPLVTLWGRDHDHLALLAWTLQNEHGVAMTFQEPIVAYRETIARRTIIDYTHRQLDDGIEQTICLVLEFAPSDEVDELRFTALVSDSSVSQSYIASVERGCRDALQKGLWGSYPLMNISLTLRALTCNPEKVSEYAVENAARAAFGKGAAKCGLIMLEPVMKLSVITPEAFVGDVIGDINKRRGAVQNIERLETDCIIQATAPVSTLSGFMNTLKAMTRDEASYTSQFSRYEPVPSRTPPEDGTFPPAAALRA